MSKVLVFATANKNKLAEIQAMLGDGYLLKDLNDIGCEVDIPENEPTLEGNALAKARYVKNNFGFDCFADDTGLEVTALNGAPGVLSARYAGEAKSDAANMDKLLAALKDEKDRSARFRTSIALLKNGAEHIFEGIVNGKIATQKTGNQGFGYDPVFIPEGHKISFAEMPMLEKAKMSHRGKAVEQLVGFLEGLG